MYAEYYESVDLSPAERTYNRLAQSEPFYSVLSRYTRKIEDNANTPTASITYDSSLEDIILRYNSGYLFESQWVLDVDDSTVDAFINGNLIPRKESRLKEENPKSTQGIGAYNYAFGLGIFIHEYSHIVYGHLTNRRREPHERWNKATDLAINSIIIATHALPATMLVPGRAQALHLDSKLVDENGNIRPETYGNVKLLELIKGLAEWNRFLVNLAPMLTSEDYDDLIRKWEEENAEAAAQLNGEKGKIRITFGVPGGGEGSEDGEGGDVELLGGDGHDQWSELPQEVRDYIREKIKHVLDKAINEVEDTRHGGKGWGSVPQQIRERIIEYVRGSVDWRQILRQFVGNLVRGDRRSTIKRINRRYPYVQPGVKRAYKARILIAVDQSGSVDDTYLQLFFGEIASITCQTTIDVVNFDTSADVKNMITLKKGQRVAAHRTRCGGTDFDAVTQLVNDPEYRGRWDGVIIFTDGMAPKPEDLRIRRMWAIGQDHKLEFATDETVINVTAKTGVEDGYI